MVGTNLDSPEKRVADHIWLKQVFADTSEAIMVLDRAECLLQPYRPLYRAIIKLSGEGYIPSPDLVWGELGDPERSALHPDGGLEWLRELAKTPPSPDEWRWAKNVLQERLVRLVFVEAADRIVRLAVKEHAPSEKLEGELVSLLRRLQDVRPKREWLEPSDLAEYARSLLEEYSRGSGVLRSGIVEIDRLVGGFRPGTLISIGAYPAHGKSIFAQALAEGLAYNSGGLCYYIDTEMGLDAVVERILQRHHGGPVRPAPGEVFTLRDVQMRYGGAIASVRGSRTYVAAPRPVTLDKVLFHSLHAVQRGARYIVWDGAQRIRGNTGDIRTDVLAVTRAAKDFAREHDVIVILTAQLVQERIRGLPHRPTREDFKESKSFSEDADYVFLLHRPALRMTVEDKEEFGEEVIKTSPGMTVVTLEKNRYGPWGPSHYEVIWYEGRSMRYAEEGIWRPGNMGSTLRHFDADEDSEGLTGNGLSATM